MENNIWILNHYAQMGSGRHYKFAHNLVGRGYKVKLFSASTVHNSDVNRINGSCKYILDEEGNLQCIYVKARSYTGNGKQRILNMMDYAKGLLSVSREFDSDKPDVIMASSVHPLTWVSGYILSKRYHAKFIAETRDLWPETLVAMGQIERKSIQARVLYSLEKFIYKKADRLVFTFPGGKDYVEEAGIDNSKVRYINNGVDLEEFDFSKDNYAYADMDLDNEEVFKILYTGSMGQANGLGYLVKAAQIIEDKGVKNIRFILFGDGYQRKELEEYLVENGIKNVVFKGKVDKKYIPNILSKSNLNIITGKHIDLYKYGLSPNKMFDYFASGKPTLSNIECGYDMLEEYKCGLTVKGGSPEDLAEGILEFYNMTQNQYDEYCQNALNAARIFDFKVLADKLEKVILELDN